MGNRKKVDKQIGKSFGKIIWKRLTRNRLGMLGLAILCVLILLAVLAPWLFPEGYDAQDYGARFIAPCWEHLCGTDNLGRDIFVRIAYGARVSMVIGLVSTSVSLLFGVSLGAIAGYVGGKIDSIIMRVLDLAMSIPQLLMAITLSAALGTGIFNCMLAVGITRTPTFARITRASVLLERNKEYVEAARCINAGSVRIVLTNVLPNAMAPILVQATMGVARAIITAAELSFIGLGVQPPSPEWGAMLSTSRQYMTQYPWTVIAPGIAIMLAVFALNVLGDGLRDALDPRLKD